jgi:glycerol-3-phosphate acyltransferase PlsY
VAVSAVLGHNHSLFLRFKGGKGVATSMGTTLVLDPLVGLMILPIGLCVIWLTRYVSAGSMVGAVSAVIIALALGRPLWEIATLALLALLIFWTHRDNYRRLQAGTERRFGERVKPEASSG